MAVLFEPSLTRVTDSNGNPVSGALLYFYTTGTTTPEAIYTTSAGSVEHSNPVVADSEGLFDPVFLTEATTYRAVLKTADGTTIWDADPIVGSTSGEFSTYLVHLSFIGTPPAQGYMGGHKFLDAVLFPADFAGSAGEVETDPASDFVISVRKNDVEVGTITISLAGAFSFNTSGGSAVSFAVGDKLTFIAPDSVGTAANFACTLEGAVQ